MPDLSYKDFSTLLEKMGSLVRACIMNSVDFLTEEKEGEINCTIGADDQLDDYCQQVVDLGLNLLRLQAPLGGDFRSITVGIRMAEELERIGDLGVNVCYRVRDMREMGILPHFDKLQYLGGVACFMVEEMISAFVRRSVPLAEQVMAKEPTANALRDELYESIIGLIKTNPENTELYLSLLRSVLLLERICDHAAYASKSISYMVKG